mmetsp:Transcript_56662/g.168643  ORF Transcript_56662/g.168643 Transcript_56662/m.168643 type:complete len:204 (+) Transcript_56662:186-797(+)
MTPATWPTWVPMGTLLCPPRASASCSRTVCRREAPPLLGWRAARRPATPLADLLRLGWAPYQTTSPGLRGRRGPARNGLLASHPGSRRGQPGWATLCRPVGRPLRCPRRSPARQLRPSGPLASCRWRVSEAVHRTWAAGRSRPACRRRLQPRPRPAWAGGRQANPSWHRQAFAWAAPWRGTKPRLAGERSVTTVGRGRFSRCC